MVFELLVLPVIQRVVGDYLSSVITRRSGERTRAEIVTQIKKELSVVHDVRDDLKTLEVAVRELDLVIKGDPGLRWRERDDVLEITPPKKLLRRQQLTPEIALDALQHSVEERRRELGLPTQHEFPEGQPEGTPATSETALPAIAGLLVPPSEEPPPVEQEPATKWTKRVLSLSNEAATERRRRVRDGE